MPFGSLLKKNQRLKALKEDDPEYGRIKKLFEEGWLHPNKPLPVIRSIFKLLKTGDEMGDYYSYNSNVKAEVGGGIVTSGMFFHGTNRACTLGDNRTEDELCSKKDCSLCAIIRDSYDVGKTGSKHNFSRFGPGIYTSACSSKADDYFKDTVSSSKTQSRALLLNAVVYGNAHKLFHTDASASSLKSGYHSVMGVAGRDLNYDETVVYKNEAIRPVYLITYGGQRERSGKLAKRRR